MPKQNAFPNLRDALKKKQMRRELFLSEMDAVVPRGRLLSLIEPHCPKAGSKGGRPPMQLETMLRVYFHQNWYALSDPLAEKPFTTARRCAALQGSSWTTTASPARPRS